VGVLRFDELPTALDPARIQQCKDNTLSIRNNAVFEVPHILEGVLKISAGRHRRILSATNPGDAGLRLADFSRSSPSLAVEALRNRTDSLPPSLGATSPAAAQGGATPTADDAVSALGPRFQRALSVADDEPRQSHAPLPLSGAAAVATAVGASDGGRPPQLSPLDPALDKPTASVLSSPVSVHRPPLPPSVSSMQLAAGASAMLQEAGSSGVLAIGTAADANADDATKRALVAPSAAAASEVTLDAAVPTARPADRWKGVALAEGDSVSVNSSSYSG
jgi:hypothetical protein